MSFDSSVKSSPNYRELLARYKVERANRLAQLGRHLVLDYQLRIRAGRDILGAPQQPNRPATQRQKARRYGETTPLVADKVLSYSGQWRVEVRGNSLWIGLPIERGGPILGRLLQRGYRIPLYSGPAVAPSLQPVIAQFLGSAFGAAAGLGGTTEEGDLRRVLGS